MDFEPTAAELAVQDAARSFAAKVLAPRVRDADERGHFDRSIVPELGRAGFIGCTLPREVGGAGATHVASALMMEELGAVDSSWRGFITVQGALCGLCLNDFASPEQKREHLPRLSRGDAIYACGLTEPQAGTDLAAISTRATPHGTGWRISGEKVWITNGGVADWILLFATVDPALKHRGLTCFLVRGNAPGLRRERMPGREMGHRGSDHARLLLENVEVGPADIVGRPCGGFHVAMGALEHGRLGVAAGAVGIHRACHDISVDFARRRRQFGQRIGDFQLVQGLIADMHANLQASRLLTLRAAWLRDRGRSNAREVSVAKYLAVENAVKAANDTILVLGSRGYTNESPAERHLRDIKGMQIYEGTSLIQRVIIAKDVLGKDQGETL